MVCSDKSQFRCENLCGNPLPCGNHFCTKICHALETQSSSNQLQRSEPCEDCCLPCQKVLYYCLHCAVLFFIHCIFYGQPIITFVKCSEAHHCLHFLSSEMISCSSKLNYNFCVKFHGSGKRAQVSTSLSSALPSWRMPSLQSAH